MSIHLGIWQELEEKRGSQCKDAFSHSLSNIQNSVDKTGLDHFGRRQQQEGREEEEGGGKEGGGRRGAGMSQ